MACKLEESPLCSNDNLVWKDAAVDVISPVNPWNKVKNVNPWNKVKNVNPWNKVKNEDLLKEQSTLSFKDIMSEDLARNLHESKEANYITPQEDFSYLTDFDEENAVETSNDFKLAFMLQQEYNKEHDDQIQREEKHFNKNSKVSVSFSNFKVCPEYHQEFDRDEMYQYLEDEIRAIDKFEEDKRTEPVIPACGYTRHNNEIVTKHDATLSGRRNAERIMSLPPSFKTGDGGGYDFHIDNKVYNGLRSSDKKDEKKKERIKNKYGIGIEHDALDVKTRLILFKMISNVVLERVGEIICTGKEAVVFHANGGTYEELVLSAECAVKIFKTTLSYFKTREKYIRNDYRFKDRMAKNNSRQIIQLWAEKEFNNLRRLHRANIACPKPLLVKDHVLVMSFIGNDKIAAPQLRWLNLTPKQWSEAYRQVVEIMTVMYHTCNLIHGDLSGYNLLWYKNECWVIDLGQAVEPSHPNALQFLKRDCTNIVGFFRSKGLTKISSPFELFKIVSGIDLYGEEEDAERLIENYERNQEMWHEGKIEEGDDFEFLWNEVKNIKESEDALEEIPEEDSSDEQDIIIENTEDSEEKKKNRRIKKKENEPLIPLESETTSPNEDATMPQCVNDSVDLENSLEYFGESTTDSDSE